MQICTRLNEYDELKAQYFHQAEKKVEEIGLIKPKSVGTWSYLWL